MMQQRTEGMGYVDWKSVETVYRQYLKAKRRRKVRDVYLIFCQGCFETGGTLIRTTDRRSRLPAGIQPEYKHVTCKFKADRQRQLEVQETNLSLIAGG